jgi:hypothetical protein
MCLNKLTSGLPGGTGGGSVGGVHLNDPLDISGGQKRRDAASAEARARADEAAKQAAIDKNVATINADFDNRGGQYADLGAALRERGNTELTRQRDEAQRQTKFALARTGNTGGSVALDKGRELNRAGAEGALAVESGAKKGVADLQAADENARTNLLTLANTGGNLTNAA